MTIRFACESEVSTFRCWVAANPSGYCIEEQPPGHRYPVLHFASCCHLGIADFDWAPLPVKCFSDVGELIDEYEEYDRNEAGFRSWYGRFDHNGDTDLYFDRIDSCDLCRPMQYRPAAVPPS